MGTFEAAVIEDPVSPQTEETPMATTHTSPVPAVERSAAAHRRVRASALAVTVLATGVIWLAAHAMGVSFKLSDSNGEVVISLPIVALFSLLFALLGWGSLALLERFAGRRAMAVWTGLAVAVTALSMVPIGLEHATSGTKAGLALIHLAVAGVLIPMLRRRA